LVAAQVVNQLIALSSKNNIYIFWDNTEFLQDAIGFWRWSEDLFIEPLILEGHVKQIFAGRVPVPWRRFELRRAVRLIALEPLSAKTDIDRLITDVLDQCGMKDPHDLATATTVVEELAFGHPGLSVAIAQYVASFELDLRAEALRKTISDEVVRSYINDVFFKDIKPEWCEILTWASVLEWFDTFVLRKYLVRVEDKYRASSNDDLIKAIAALRTQGNVVWRVKSGDRLHGVIRNVVRQHLKLSDPLAYHTALRAAEETFAAIADDYAQEDEDFAATFRDQAAKYRKRLEKTEGQAQTKL
jgi:hypothetical protein